MIRAIICDDERAALILIKHLIDSQHLPIEITGTARNGVEALKLIQTEKPDLVFLDIEMPLMNGLEVLERAGNSKVIIITAYDSFEHAQRALRLGASDILAKPIDLGQLKEAMYRAIGWIFTDNEAVNTVLEYLHGHYREQCSLTQLAELACCSAGHLSRMFKKYMGISILNYIHKLRIEESIRLLKQGLTVREAAERAGYQNMNHYYQYFKEFTGETPAKYGKHGGKG